MKQNDEKHKVNMTSDLNHSLHVIILHSVESCYITLGLLEILVHIVNDQIIKAVCCNLNFINYYNN